MAAAMPSLTSVQPQAVSPGKTVEVTLRGDHFTDDLRLWTSFSEKVEFVKCINTKQAVFRITTPKGAHTQVGALRVYDRTGLSGPILMMIDPLPTTTATSTDKTKPQLLKLPVAVDGRMGGLNSHWFTFEAKAGQRVSIEVYAERIASTADPMIHLMDPNGREVDYADDDDVLGSDAGLIHTVKITGQYRLELRDVQYRGGLPYRLRIGDFPIWPKLKAGKGQVTEKEPNDKFEQASPIEMGNTVFGSIEKPGARDHFKMKGKKGQWVSFRVYSRRIGSPSYIYLELLDAVGKSIATAGTENTLQTILRHKLPADGEFTIRVEELLRRGGPRFAYRIDTLAGSGEFNLNLKSGKNTADKFWGIAGQQGEVDVEHCLPGAAVAIEHRPVAVLRVPLILGDLCGARNQSAHHRRVPFLDVVQRRDVPAGDDEHMERRLRIDVLERQQLVVLVDDLRGDLAVGDLAEQTVVGHVWPRYASPRRITAARGIPRRSLRISTSVSSG